MKLKISLGVLLIFFISCKEEQVINKYKNFEEQKWHIDSIAKFNYFIDDSLANYTVKCIAYECDNTTFCRKAAVT